MPSGASSGAATLRRAAGSRQPRLRTCATAAAAQTGMRTRATGSTAVASPASRPAISQRRERSASRQPTASGIVRHSEYAIENTMDPGNRQTTSTARRAVCSPHHAAASRWTSNAAARPPAIEVTSAACGTGMKHTQATARTTSG